MVTVAIAGGGSSIASNIIAAILATKKHKLVILTRSPRPGLEAQGAVVKPVDYASHAQLVDALQGVDTVYSCIWTHGPDIQATQLALLDAAKEAKVRRFVPSEWSVPAYDAVAFYKPKEAVWEAVKKSGLEYTRFICGIWMNVWGPGATHDEVGARAGYAGPPFLADIKGGSIAVPGDGTGKISTTHMVDVGKYAAAALDFDKWEPDSVVVGDELTVNELADKIEQATGKPLTRNVISLEAIKAVLAGETDPATQMIHEFFKIIVEGGYGLTPNVNQRVPEVVPIKVDEFLKKHWGA
ncbi:NAD(P)-binding protein [Trichoderma citrinoviride]|uniref:NAD(P)-binding protein n=1 Tax=Trichoderma citrinoviride TaxID=58853 RepID=A0A2T4B925_9HYPO|nr:NAD(P)-binding protein [Trichoderma citrinoviride]PTB65833.1 NAD(P)-binding protein [Trichoderma citrinoviride]